MVAGMGLLLLAAPTVWAQSDRPDGDGLAAARAGDEGPRGRDNPQARPRLEAVERMRAEAERGEHAVPGQRGGEPKMTVIHLQHISAEAYMQVVQQLCHNPAVGESLGKVPVAMCEQANAVVVLGPPEAVAFFHELATGLDQPSEFHQRMHARQMEMSRQEAEMRQHFGPAGGGPGGGPMMGPGRMGPGPMGMGMMGRGMGPMGMGMGHMGMGMGPMGKGPMGVCPKCQGPMGACPKCQGPAGMCPKCQGGPGVCPKCQGAMGDGKSAPAIPAQPMPGGGMMGRGGMMGGGMMPDGMPMPGAPMPGQPMPGAPMRGGEMMPGAPMPGGGPTMQRPPASDEDALMERLRQRRKAEMQRTNPGSPAAAPKEGGKPQAANSGEGKPSDDRMLDEALADPGMPVVKRLLSSPLAGKLHLDRQQIEKIEGAATAHRQKIDHLRDRLANALKDADPKDRQAAAQKLIPGARTHIEQLTAELRGRIGEVLTAEQRETLEQALRAAEGQGGDRSRALPRRGGPPRGEPGQTGPDEPQ
jgi:hypothetical protein